MFLFLLWCVVEIVCFFDGSIISNVIKIHESFIKCLFLMLFSIILWNNGCIRAGIVELIFQRLDIIVNIFKYVMVSCHVYNNGCSQYGILAEIISFNIESTGRESIHWFFWVLWYLKVEKLLQQILRQKEKYGWLEHSNQVF